MTGGVAIDVASVRRVTAALQRRPGLVQRIYTERERIDCAHLVERWATRWAAKEAVRKLHGSAGRPLPAFADVEVAIDAHGAPSLRISGQATDLTVSLSHEGDVAVAVVAGPPAVGTFAAVPAGLCLAERGDQAHKGTFGTVVVVGGAVGFSGAPLMSAMAAARGGAGRTRLCVPEPIYGAVAAQTLEVMTHPLAAAEGGIAESALDAVRELQQGAQAIVLGPGMGRATETERLLLTLLGELPAPAVVDADGLNIAAAHAVDWRRCPQPVVLTPHPAEMARLTGLSTTEVQAQRRQVAGQFAERTGAVVVLKGSDTMVAAPDGRWWTSELRVVALASGGSGDVLSGLLAALLAQGLEPFDAACAAVFIHAEAGLAVQQRRGRAGALPRDVLEELPAAQERVRREIERRQPTR